MATLSSALSQRHLRSYELAKYRLQGVLSSWVARTPGSRAADSHSRSIRIRVSSRARDHQPLHLPALRAIMSQTTPTGTSTSNFRTIFVAAIKAYEKKTKTDLLSHPLATQLESCNSSTDILAVLHDRVNEFDESKRHKEKLSSWLKPTINVLYAFSATLGGGVGLVGLNLIESPSI